MLEILVLGEPVGQFHEKSPADIVEVGACGDGAACCLK